MDNLQELSQKMLFQLRMGEDPQAYIKALGNIDLEVLVQALNSDAKKKAFWLNLYNAFSLFYLRKNPKITTDKKLRRSHFRTAKINIAGNHLSLDDIEHGILRKSKIWWSMGLLNKWFPGELEKKLRVNKLDFRVHFALNCGGASCPPIRFYEPEKIDQQLDLAARAFVSMESIYDKRRPEVLLSQIFRWYWFDFGGKGGIEQLLLKYNIIQEGVKPKFHYAPYNWNPEQNPFAEE